MSLQGKRAEIAAVLDTVTDVKGYPKRPKATKSGDGWPQWSGSERDEQSGQFAETWRVLIELPADEAAADAWVDEHRDELWDALSPAGWITAFEPVDIGQDNRPRINGLMITMRSE